MYQRELSACLENELKVGRSKVGSIAMMLNHAEKRFDEFGDHELRFTELGIHGFGDDGLGCRRIGRNRAGSTACGHRE